MNKKLWILAVVIFSILNNNLQAENGAPHYFNTGEVNELMKKAGSEGKLFFIDFYRLHQYAIVTQGKIMNKQKKDNK